jgi:hypothetical protein
VSGAVSWNLPSTSVTADAPSSVLTVTDASGAPVSASTVRPVVVKSGVVVVATGAVAVDGDTGDE